MARYKMHVVNPRLLYLLESFLKKMIEGVALNNRPL